jgi:hypothetical protein
MWNMESFIISVVIGAIVIVIKGLKSIWKNTGKAFNRFYKKISCVRDIYT